MVVKKKSVHHKKVPSIASEPPEPIKEEERASFVTQVVEEVDENGNSKPVMTTAPEEVIQDIQDINPSPPEIAEVISNPPLSSEDPPQEEIVEEKKKEELDEIFHTHNTAVMPEISVHRSPSHKKILIWAAVVLGICLFVGGALLVLTGGSFASIHVPRITAAPTPTPESTPTPTPQPLTRADISIEVQNGGGVPGAASKMKQFLEDKGYKVASTGNAKDYSYDKTEILVKSAKSAYLSLLQNDLKDSYALGTASATLPDDASTDARVIVGKK